MRRRSLLPSLVLATHNLHKVTEIRAILRQARLRARVLTLNDFPKMPDVIENKSTIEGNAIKKAREISRKTGCWALADDTGLFISALKGKPGVYSARFAGPRCNYEDNNRKVLRLMSRVPWAKRQAMFRCVAALATPVGKSVTIEGRLRGRITTEIKGKNGFGYDPIFWIPSLKKTLAEIKPRQKNRISHRARAFAKIPSLLRRFLKRG